MMRIINSRIYQGLIPVTNYMILGVLAIAGVATVFLAYPILSACIGVAIEIYRRGNETITRHFVTELKRHFWLKLGVGLVVSTFALLFYYVFNDLFAKLQLPMKISLIVSLILFFALVYYLILEEYAQKEDFHVGRWFQNAVLDIVVELPYTILLALITGVILVIATAIPLSTYFSLTFLNVILASLYHKHLKSKLSRF